MKSLKHVTLVAIASRIWILTWTWLVHAWFPSYDTSIDSNSWNVFKGLLSWDAVYFKAIAERDYRWEQEYAFLPGYPRLVSWLSGGKNVEIYGIILSNVAFVLAVRSLYRLTCKVGLRHLATSSALFYCTSPASVFASAMYSESLFAVLSFWGMEWWLERGMLSAVACFGLASLVRSNGVLLAGFFGYSMLFETKRNRFWSMLCGIASALPFFLYQHKIYQTLCLQSRPFCGKFTLPYTFIQSHYWDVGLFRYWNLNQLGMWIIGFPMLVLVRQSLHNNLTTKSIPFYILLAYLTLHTVLFAHVQIIQRLVLSMPALYWTCARLWTKSIPWKRFLILYHVLWGQVINPTLFATFLPPA